MRLRSNKACGNKSKATIAICLEQQSREAKLKVLPRGMRLRSKVFDDINRFSTPRREVSRSDGGEDDRITK